LYLPPWTTEILIASPSRGITTPTQKPSIVTRHIDELLAPETEPEVIREILHALFPVIQAGGHQSGHASVDRAANQYRAEQRLTHPECFSKYFRFMVSEDELADATVRGVIEKWKGLEEKELEVSVA